VLSNGDPIPHVFLINKCDQFDDKEEAKDGASYLDNMHNMSTANDVSIFATRD
jgi:hypothetical protein